MELSKPIGTFRELAQSDLEIRVVCQRCGHEAILDADSPALRDRKLAGQRFRCTQVLANGKRCGGIGLPSIGNARLGKSRRWPGRLAEHARKTREPR
ncbi:MAG TPA: hypothetical protein VFB13_21940 [Reyranella sp.]|nr:hypothetical protein [Reyranella sp.]